MLASAVIVASSLSCCFAMTIERVCMTCSRVFVGLHSLFLESGFDGVGSVLFTLLPSWIASILILSRLFSSLIMLIFPSSCRTRVRSNAFCSVVSLTSAWSCCSCFSLTLRALSFALTFFSLSRCWGSRGAVGALFWQEQFC